jgi:hypothetical protein
MPRLYMGVVGHEWGYVARKIHEKVLPLQPFFCKHLDDHYQQK